MTDTLKGSWEEVRPTPERIVACAKQVLSQLRKATSE